MNTYLVRLPPERWTTCRRCDGTGLRVEEGDAHQSAGEVPCSDCDRGIVKIEALTEEEYRRREEQAKKKKTVARKNADEVKTLAGTAPEVERGGRREDEVRVRWEY